MRHALRDYNPADKPSIKSEVRGLPSSLTPKDVNPNHKRRQCKRGVAS